MKSKEFVVGGVTLTLVTYVLALSLVGQVLSALQTSRTVSNTGTVKAIGVGVYWESGCINPVTSINWTTLEPGQKRNQTVYIKNTSNVPVTLSMVTQKWQPSNAASYIALTWNSEGRSLNPDEVIPSILTLTVDSSITGITNFSFEIVIVGSG